MPNSCWRYGVGLRLCNEEKAQQGARANDHDPSFFDDLTAIQGSVLSPRGRGSSLTLGKESTRGSPFPNSVRMRYEQAAQRDG